MSAERPHLSYFLCATPRSGSSLLCALLRRTRLAGWPWEYFSVHHEDRWMQRWQVSGPAEYLQAAIEAGTDNGVFGVKVFWHHMSESLFEKLRAVHGRDANEFELLQVAFPSPRFIWLTRQDLLAQAVSHTRALQTDQWTHAHSPKGDPRFDFERIERRLDYLRKWNQSWEEWFESHGIQPFRITYEELVKDIEGSLRAILGFLDLELSSGPGIECWHKKQADEINGEWLDRYRAIAGERAATRYGR